MEAKIKELIKKKKAQLQKNEDWQEEPMTDLMKKLFEARHEEIELCISELEEILD